MKLVLVGQPPGQLLLLQAKMNVDNTGIDGATAE